MATYENKEGDTIITENDEEISNESSFDSEDIEKNNENTTSDEDNNVTNTVKIKVRQHDYPAAKSEVETSNRAGHVDDSTAAPNDKKMATNENKERDTIITNNDEETNNQSCVDSEDMDKDEESSNMSTAVWNEKKMATNENKERDTIITEKDEETNNQSCVDSEDIDKDEENNMSTAASNEKKMATNENKGDTIITENEEEIIQSSVDSEDIGKDNENINSDDSKLTSPRIIAKTKRSLPVVPPENYHGNVEYKRQVHQASAARLTKLATQMSFRLDEGEGVCMYRIGVEDEGFHSLLHYDSVSESARILECIARSINAVVIERKIIQNEIVQDENGNLSVARGGESSNVIEVIEPSILGNGQQEDNGNKDESENTQTPSGNSNLEGKHNSNDKNNTLDKIHGCFTRAEIKIQRIRTHLLDKTPVSAVEWAEATAKSVSTVADGATKATTMAECANGSADSEGNLAGDETSTPDTSNTQVSSAQQSPSQQKQGNGGSTKNNVMPIGETLSLRNIRVAVLGDVDAGKSTMIGTLTTLSLDDGHGKSRTSIMKHRHEIESGRTSTVSTHLMGFRSTGKPIGARDNLRTQTVKSEDEIALSSYKVITLMDLAGHEKYLKTTIHGVTSGMSDYALILVNSREPPSHMTQQHLNLCCSFKIPVIVVFTKVDGCPETAFSSTKAEVKKLLRSYGKKPFDVRNEQDIAACMDKLQAKTPLISTSCVTGNGISQLQKMLFSLPKRRRHEGKVHRPFEFLVEDLFLDVPGVDGAVVSGFVNAGELTVGASCNVFVGPTSDGSFIKTVAKSAHIARIDTTHITSGQSACLALYSSDKDELRNILRRGMVVLKSSPTSTRHFDAEICVLKGEATTIRQSKSYQAFVHILNVRQSAFARNIEVVSHPGAQKKKLVQSISQNGNPSSTILQAKNATTEQQNNQNKDDNEDNNDGIVLRPGSRAKVRFEFAQRPEYVRPGMRMFFRDGRARGVGIITGITQIKAVN